MASGLLEMIFLFRSRLLQQMRDTISNLLKIIFLFRGTRHNQYLCCSFFYSALLSLEFKRYRASENMTASKNY